MGRTRKRRRRSSPAAPDSVDDLMAEDLLDEQVREDVVVSGSRSPQQSPVEGGPLEHRCPTHVVEGAAGGLGSAAGGSSAPAWCEVEQLLASMNAFCHLPCSSLQSDADIQGFCGLLQRFVCEMEAEHPLPPWLPAGAADLQAICQAAAFTCSHAAGNSGSGGGIKWFPRYGCAVLALAPCQTQAAPGHVRLTLLGLDDWRFRLHSTSDGGTQHTADCGGAQVLPCGSIPATQLETFFTRLQALLSKAEARKEKQRSSRGSKRQGHQMTPAFIHALARQALEAQAAAAKGGEEAAEAVEELPPRGGFTDVGIHTGGTPRDTAWPLVREAFKAVLELGMAASTGGGHPSPDLFPLTLAHLHLWLAQRQAQLITPTSATRTALDAGMQMLGAAASSAAELAEQGHSMAAFEAACQEVRQQLGAAAAERARCAADAATLPPLLDCPGGGPCGPGSYRCPRGKVPPVRSVRNEGADMEAAKQRAAANLGSLPLPGATESGWVAALASASKQCQTLWEAGGGDVAAQHVLSMVEQELFRRAAPAGGLKADGVPGRKGVQALADVLDAYRTVLHGFLATPAAAARLRSELLSREVLVTWIATCLMHAASCSTYPLLRSYGLPLLPADLRHLVLSDRAACDALLGVAQYLEKHSRGKPAVFSLRDGESATFALAAQFARGDAGMAETWRLEQAAAAQRQQAHWAEVHRKQRLAAQLRKELRQRQDAEGRARRAYEDARQEYRSYRSERNRDEENKCWSKLISATSKREATEAQLETALAAPAPVIQPLPQQQERAYQWLFFLKMPDMLRRLSRACFLAQQLLVPLAPNGSLSTEVSKCIKAPDFTLHLSAHYNTHQASAYLESPRRKGSDGRVHLMSTNEVPEPEKIQPGPTVDSYLTEQQGMWHPDSLDMHLGWSGSGVVDAPLGGQWFNPFAPVPAALVTEHFTEQLPAMAAALQWAMPQYGSLAATAANRGSLPVALQEQQPRWLTKPGFLAFGALRSYPLTQLRQLAVALHQRSLPLGHPAVQTLVRQVLYHVGTLVEASPGHRPSLLWRTDWGSGGSVAGDMLATLCAELAGLAEELRESPSEQASVLLLGEAAAFLAAWHPPMRDVARRLAGIAAGWAADLEAEAVPLRAKQCLLRLTALLCFGGSAGPSGGGQAALRREDAQLALSLAVQIHHGSIYGQALEEEGEGSRELKVQLAQLRVLCHWAMPRRADELLAAAVAHPAMLTAAVRTVLHIAPTDLAWEQLYFTGAGGNALPAGSFQAVGSDGHLYSLNCLDGTVLVDGAPPGRLPSEILRHPLYLRTFSADGSPWGFEVVLGDDGMRRSIAPVRGCHYEFSLADDGGGLVVAEIDDQGNRLELLEVGDTEACPCPGWGEELPPRLRELHSHWLSREKRTIVLRPPHFRDHTTHFLLRWAVPHSSAPQGSADVEYTCLRVPQHQHTQPWTVLRQLTGAEALTDQLVLHSSKVTQVLSQFEQPAFIHTYIEAAPSCSSGSRGAGSKRSRKGGRGVGSAGGDSSRRSSGSRPPRTMLFELPRFGLEFELRGGSLLSRDFAGYRLRACQRLVETLPAGASGAAGTAYTLPDFGQYLILEKASGQPSSSSSVGGLGAHLQVVVPIGSVQHRGIEVEVKQSSKSNAKLKYHNFSVHPRLGHLHSDSIAARMQLAALHAASGSLLPEPSSQATGGQLAMRVARQCWATQPADLPAASATFALTDADLAHLSNAAKLGGHLAAGLRLVVSDVLSSASQLSALYFPDGVPDSAAALACPPDWGLAYLQECQSGSSPRQLLTAGDEVRMLMHRRPPLARRVWQRHPLFTPVEVPPCPVDDSVVASTEAGLGRLLVPTTGSRGTAGPAYGQPGAVPPPYPLHVPNGATELERQMHAELKGSWDTYHLTLAALQPVPDAKQHILQAQACVHEWREQAQCYLLAQLGVISPELGLPGTAMRLRQTCGQQPLPGLRDLFELALPDNSAQQLNPFLSATSAQRLRQAALTWLQLCVLEDKMGRLAGWVDDPAEQASLVQELQCSRIWRVEEHPEWLVFEAEQQLQIRPHQYVVASHLLTHPGEIVQLNMGEGKTRVILPMLILHKADGNHVVRLNLLVPLLAEAFAHLHSCLCGSVLGRKLFLMPFHRDVQPTPGLVAAMLSALTHCKQERGVLLVTAGQRLSLLLKRQELWLQEQHALCAQLDCLLAQPYEDLLDESDELLSHRYQLVYAWGSPTGMDSEQTRTLAGHSLLHHLARQATQGPIGAILARPRVAVVAGAAGRPGAFPGVRLLPGDALEAALPELRRQLALAVLDDPPYALLWMRRFPHGSPGRASLLSCMLHRGMDARPLLSSPALGLTDDQREAVLALRGLLAHGVMEHCLQMRVNVDFGVDRSHTARKRLAVPFRAAHMPSERSEYAQPDTALTLTALAYYSDGLAPSQVEEAICRLLSCGEEERRDCYEEWLTLARADLDPEALAALDDVRKLDPTNPVQMALAHTVFSHNTAAVNFWLSSCVIPAETRVYDYRLPSSAWHLADTPGGAVVGFSGTNDNHRLLPLQVRQQLHLADAGLQGTNGKMLALLLVNPHFDTLAPEQGEEVWQALLGLAVRSNTDALIDCGAMLAGTTNRRAAEYLASHLLPRGGRWAGVCYFDDSEGERAWMVLDLQGRRLKREVSPIREGQAFCIFDEARCRGADLKLRPDAWGLLTLGPTTTKDKMMQAAGRLRKLGKGQRLRITATPDIAAKIRAASPQAVAGNNPAAGSAGGPPLTSHDVLQWVMANTVRATLRGVLEWAHHGLVFAAAKGSPEHMLQPEVVGLEELHGSASSPAPLGQLVAAQRDKRQREGLATDMCRLMAKVAERAALHGAGHSVMAHGGLGEECERECEREEEEEEEEERQVARVPAAAERDWDYARALGAASLQDLSLRTGLQPVPLTSLVARLHPDSLATLPWSRLVFCTPNFQRATKLPEGAHLNEYLRAVGFVLLLPGGQGDTSAGRTASKAAAGEGGAVLLLTEREANGLLEVLWQSGASGSRASSQQAVPLLASLCYACAAQQPGGAAPLRLAVALAPDRGWAAPGPLAGQLQQGGFMPQLVTASLFNGGTTYADPRTAGDSWEEVRQLAVIRSLSLLVHGQAAAAETLVSMRGRTAFFLRSQLERACNHPEAEGGQ